MGGGPSLFSFDFKRLANKVTIACNKAVLYFTPTYLVYMDDQFYDWYEADVRSFKGLKFTHSWNKERDDVIFTRNLGPLGLSDDFEDGLYHGGNSAYFALNLAYVMGGNPIYLFGIDMCYQGNSTHFHDGYPKDDDIGEERFKHMINAFNYGSIVLKEKGVKVYNCSEMSRLECFDKLPLDLIG